MSIGLNHNLDPYSHIPTLKQQKKAVVNNWCNNSSKQAIHNKRHVIWIIDFASEHNNTSKILKIYKLHYFLSSYISRLNEVLMFSGGFVTIKAVHTIKSWMARNNYPENISNVYLVPKGRFILEMMLYQLNSTGDQITWIMV